MGRMIRVRDFENGVDKWAPSKLGIGVPALQNIKRSQQTVLSTLALILNSGLKPVQPLHRSMLHDFLNKLIF